MQKFLYKYRAIDVLSGIENDKALRCLFECKAVFSSRTQFNDLFDSKIHFHSLSEIDIQRALELRIARKEQDPNEIEQTFSTELNKILDSYVFYSISANSRSNLMWSHYADCHRGFCIEFKKEHLNANPINYSARIAELGLMYCMDVPKNGVKIGAAIQKALLVKLNEWKYEKEYRVFPSHELRDPHLLNNGQIALIPYEPGWVESIIFGCRMPKHIQKYIIDHYPHKTKFKIAVERMSYIDIIDA